MPYIPTNAVQFIVVDDQPFLQRIIGQILRTREISDITFADNGQAAIDLLTLPIQPRKDARFSTHGISGFANGHANIYGGGKSAHSHCVITDFGMPQANGLALVKAIRCGRTNVPRDTPVILVTGYSEDYIVSAALLLDVNAFVLKPLSSDDLWKRVGRCLETDWNVRSADVYAAVEVPNSSVEPTIQTSNAMCPGTHSKNEIRCLPLSKIVPGDILADDLLGVSGRLLLRHGVVLSKGLLQKLSDLSTMDSFGGTIAVFRPSSVLLDARARVSETLPV